MDHHDRDAPLPPPEDSDNFSWWDIAGALPEPTEQIGGCCWTAAGESCTVAGRRIFFGDGTRFSRQQEIDCVDYSIHRHLYGPDVDIVNGKDILGYSVEESYKYILRNGWCTSEDYSITGQRGHCRQNQHDRYEVLRYYKKIPSWDKFAVRARIRIQPVILDMPATPSFENLGRHVVYDFSRKEKLQLAKNSDHYPWHSMMVTGFGTIKNKDYYEVLNSWHPTWAHDGCARVGTHLVGREFIYPVVKGGFKKSAPFEKVDGGEEEVRGRNTEKKVRRMREKKAEQKEWWKGDQDYFQSFSPLL